MDEICIVSVMSFSSCRLALQSCFDDGEMSNEKESRFCELAGQQQSQGVCCFS